MCEIEDGRLAVVGSAWRWECLHSLAVRESPSCVLITARLGRLDARGTRARGLAQFCTLWVAEVTLREPLGARAVRTVP